VILSDGTILDLSADIDALLWDVGSVNYTVHVPAGLHVIGVIRTPNWPTTKETFTILTDSTAGRYDTATVVTTRQRNVGVSANLLVKTALLKIGMASASGQDRQTLRAIVTFR